MSGRAFHRILAVCLLGLWLAPSAGALAVGLHVALAHDGGHHDHGDEGRPSARLDELLAAVAHGHRHSVDGPSHDHPAYVDAATGLSPGPSAALAVPAEPVAPSEDGHAEPGGSRHRRAPPGPLIYFHCSLLL
jgi:hypothetical protein